MDFEERRKSPRRRVRRGALLDWPGLAAPRLCTVRNISEGGAMIAVPNTADIPERFRLTTHEGRVIDCQLIWRTDAQMGVKFL
jgi:hypothetical protein